MNVTTSTPTASFDMNNIDDLFHLYHALINPLKELEYNCQQKEKTEQTQRNAYNAMHPSIIAILVQAITITVMLTIPFVIIFPIVGNLIHVNDTTTLYRAYDTWLSSFPPFRAFFGWISNMMQSGSILISLAALLLSLFVGFVVFPSIIILLPITLLFTIIATIIFSITGKKTFRTCTTSLTQLEQQIDSMITNLSVPLSFVPPSYRYSAALIHFCSSYANGRASTLKEAIEAYELDVHRQKLENAQQEILQSTLELTQQIQYQNIKIDALQNSMDKVKHKVDWL